MNVFSLKQVSSTLMIVVDEFSTNPFMSHYRLKRRKNYECLAPFFYFVSFVLNVIVFDYNGLKQSLICKQNKTVCYKFIFFHRNLIYVYLKKGSSVTCGETWVLVWHYISHICWHLLFCFANLH